MPVAGTDRSRNVILTGIARSGTTLACALLNRLPQVVALHEPMSPRRLVWLWSRRAVVDRIEAFFATQRTSLLTRGEASSRTRDGRIPDNPYADEPGPDGRRRSVVRDGVVRFEKPLDADFRLVIKHPSCFTALLDGLVGRFPCVAVVRNPLAVLLSWHSTEGNWNRGRQPAAEAFDVSLRRRLDAEPDCLSRQLRMLEWSFSQYATYLPASAVLRYEDIVTSGGAALAAIDPAAAALAEPLRNKNSNPFYRGADVAALAERLLAHESPWRAWYAPEAIIDLASTFDA